MSDQLDEALLKKLQGLSNLAAKTSHPEEAASAAAKFQELLLKHNLDAATVSDYGAVKDGKREEAKVEGGAYKFQRELWASVARLNFCLHWMQPYDVWVKGARVGSGAARYTTEKWVSKKRHMLVGKMVNTRATIALAQYLEAAIERATVERLKERHGDESAGVNSQRFSKWAVSLRKGAARRIVEKLEDRRSQFEEAAAKKAREDAARAERAGTSSETTVTIADVQEAERTANIDFRFGDGTSARWAADRAERARLDREADEEYTRWAAANPLEAAAKEKKAREDRMKRHQRSESASRRTDDVDRSAYWEGYDLAEKIGLDQQVDRGTSVGRLGYG